jgi:predicted GNAT family acetyltransferase
MRKSIAYILVFTMLLSFGWTSFGSENAKAAVGVDEQVVADFSDEVDIRAKTGLISGQDSNHGNHQTRVVRTSHGSYVAYVTDYRGGKYLQHPTQGLSEISVMKINKDGTIKLIMQHVKSYDASQVSLIVDKDENVWAGLVYENGFRDQFDAHKNGMVLEFFRIDAETDEVNGYSTIVSDIDINGGGIGYGVFQPVLYEADASVNYKYKVRFIHVLILMLPGSQVNAAFLVN